MRPMRYPALIILILSTSPGHLTAQACVGDCDGDRSVTVDEVLVMVNVALGTSAVTQCAAGDGNQDGSISIDEILVAVGNALNGCPTPATSCTGPLVSEGLQRLSEGNLRAANAAFAQAVDEAPGDDCANVLHALTRIPALAIDHPGLNDLMRRSGGIVSGDSRDVCAMDLRLPNRVPITAPAMEEIADALRDTLLPEVQQALAQLGRVSTTVSIRFDLRRMPDCLRIDTLDDIVEFDRADLIVLEVGLHAAAAVFDLLGAYDLNVGLQPAIDQKPRTVLQNHPQLLELRSASRLASARQHLDRALSKAVDAIDAILAESDSQDDDILVVDPEDRKDAARARLLATFVRQALTGQVTVPIDIVTGEIVMMDVGLLQPERLNLDPLFSGQFSSIRPFLPGFDDKGNLKLSQLPDPTFAGTAPDLTIDKINHIFDGGPECAVCADERDCNPFGIGEYECRACRSDPRPCTGAPRRCSGGYASCDDGDFY